MRSHSTFLTLFAFALTFGLTETGSTQPIDRPSDTIRDPVTTQEGVREVVVPLSEAERSAMKATAVKASERNPGVARTRLVRLDKEALQTDHREERCVVKFGRFTCFDWCLGSSADLTLFSDRRFRIVNDSVTQTHLDVPDPTWTWVGRIEGEPSSSVILSFSDSSDEMTGHVISKRGVFELQAIENGIIAIYELDRSQAEEKGIDTLNLVAPPGSKKTLEQLEREKPSLSEHLDAMEQESDQGGDPSVSHESAAGKGGGFDTITVFAYNTSAVGNPTTTASAGVAAFNSGLDISGIYWIRAQRVGPVPTVFHLGGSVGVSALHALTVLDSDAAITSLRNHYAGDIVVGLGQPFGGVCGKASTPAVPPTTIFAPTAYIGTTWRSCSGLPASSVMSHEIAHVFGAGHDNSSGSFSDAKAWVGTTLKTLVARGSVNKIPAARLSEPLAPFDGGTIPANRDNLGAVLFSGSVVEDYRTPAGGGGLQCPAIQLFVVENECQSLNHALWSTNDPYTGFKFKKGSSIIYEGGNSELKFTIASQIQVCVQACLGTCCGAYVCRTAEVDDDNPCV